MTDVVYRIDEIVESVKLDLMKFLDGSSKVFVSSITLI